MKPGFEGGQTRLILRMPKRGFNSGHRPRITFFNVGQLADFSDGAVVDEVGLRSAGLVKGQVEGWKVLGDGELKKKLTVRATQFSAGAKAKIEAAGGRCELLVTAATPAKA